MHSMHLLSLDVPALQAADLYLFIYFCFEFLLGQIHLIMVLHVFKCHKTELR